jgi:hypothetical protein
MKKIFLILFAFCCISILDAHPMHVSVVNITVDEYYIHINVSTFVDDWETAYFHYYGDTISFRSKESIREGWFKKHFNESFQIMLNQNNEALDLEWDRISFNDVSLRLEMHVKLEYKPKTLYIYNSILTDIFADQNNLLIYSSGGKEKGIKFDIHNKEEELIFR